MRNVRIGTSLRLAMAAIPLVWAVPAAPAAAAGDGDYRALPRPLNYALPIAPAGGVRTVIVYGRDAPWTRTAAEAVQRAIREWSGVGLDLADDRTVTGEATWLLADAWRATPLIVLGNSQDNRVMHALGTRYLLQSNRNWPGGDRCLIRSIFEPFAADVNYVAIEASGALGLDGAVACFAALLRALPPGETAIPPMRLAGGTRDPWTTEVCGWKPPAEWTNRLHQSATQLAASFRGPIERAGWDAVRGSAFPIYLMWWANGGIPGRADLPAATLRVDPGVQRAMAAMALLGIRDVGGRPYDPIDHYGAMQYLTGLRALFQSGQLTAQELNEVESALTLSGACPNNYVYDNIARGNVVGAAWGDRHSMACLLTTLYTLDYVLNHCRLDARTRQELERRYDGARKSAALLVRSFRNNLESSCLGEDTVLMLYATLYEGHMDHVRSGMLRRSADMYILTTDNLPSQLNWGCYAGLAGFSSSPGGMRGFWLGGALVMAAAYYYDDPTYRWFLRNRALPGGSEATQQLPMHPTFDATGGVAEPTRYLGVNALPYDERLYRVAKDPEAQRAGGFRFRPPPEPIAKAADRVAFRDGFAPDDAYLFLATSQDPPDYYPAQNNAIARYSDLGELWLYHNTMQPSTWSRNVVSISNGKSYAPLSGCLLEALANLDDIGVVAAREPGVGGTDWTRAVVHWRGHYFAVLDRMEARQDDDFTFVCRWRSPQPASLDKGVWTATATGNRTLRIQSAVSLFQTAEYWPIDGSARPYVLQQYKQARLAKGQAETFQNLLAVAGPTRPDRFEARLANAEAMLVKGRTAAGAHLALFGTRGRMPLTDFETDAAVYGASENRLYLAGATTLQAGSGRARRTLLRADQPVNALVDCAAGTGTVEIAGTQAVAVALADGVAAARAPGRHAVTVAAAGDLPVPAGQLERLWAATPATAVPAQTALHGGDGPSPFRCAAAREALRKPRLRIDTVETSATPPAAPMGNRLIWYGTDNLAITLAFPTSTAVDSLRVVGTCKPAGLFGPGHSAYGQPNNAPGDFTFALVLSDDGFQRDLRTNASPVVTMEETPSIGVGHGSMLRLPTWRVAVGATARQIRLLPRAAATAPRDLNLTRIDVDGAASVDELAAKAVAADVDGDGVNELVVATSEKELAVHDAAGKRRWTKACAGDILRLGAEDLETDGKAEILAYLATEKLMRVNGDGTERPGGDLYAAQMEYFKQSGSASITAMAAWAPDGAARKEVLLWSEPCFRVKADGSVALARIRTPQGAGRLVNLYPGEPEVLAAVSGYGLTLWSARRDAGGEYVRLASRPVKGSDAGEMGGFCWVQQVDAAEGLLTAVQHSLDWHPIAAFAPGGEKLGWGFNTGGIPVTGALAADVTGDGVPEALLARADGFVNVFRLADGALLGLLRTGEPILGLCLLKGRDGQPLIAVGTKFGAHLFAADFRPLGRQPLSIAAFAGPTGPARDRAYVVQPNGDVTVLSLN
jgi:hypothetical protein